MKLLIWNTLTLCIVHEHYDINEEAASLKAAKMSSWFLVWCTQIPFSKWCCKCLCLSPLCGSLSGKSRHGVPVSKRDCLLLVLTMSYLPCSLQLWCKTTAYDRSYTNDFLIVFPHNCRPQHLRLVAWFSCKSMIAFWGASGGRYKCIKKLLLPLQSARL